MLIKVCYNWKDDHLALEGGLRMLKFCGFEISLKFLHLKPHLTTSSTSTLYKAISVPSCCD